MKRVVCIGSRLVARHDLGYLDSIGQRTVAAGDLLVSGNAPGADQAFALGGNMVNAEMVELCLPWAGFEKKWIAEDPDYTYDEDWRERGIMGGNRIRVADDATMDHLRLANDAHPVFSRLRAGQQKMLVRNAMMMVDDHGVLSDVVIAWPDRTARGWGGTGHALRVAWALQIPVWLANASCWWDGVMRG